MVTCSSFRHLNLLLALSLSSLPLWGQEEVNLDDLPPAPPPLRVGPVTLHLYSDLDIQVDSLRDNPAATPTLFFKHNHVDLLVQGQYQDLVSVETDVFNADKYLEVTVFPLPGQSLRFGHILLPFGEFNLHHIYGGKDDEQQLLFPQLWSDTGASYRWEGPSESIEAYVVNGFAVPDGGGEPDPGMGGNPHNWLKALGIRGRFNPVPGSLVSLSVLGHEYDQTELVGNTVVYAGLDGATKWGALTLKAGGMMGNIWWQDAPAGPQQWSRWGTYGEATLTLAPDFNVRLRGGQMDPDSRYQDLSDQWNVNLALLWHFAVMDVNVVLFHNQETWFTGAGPNNSNQLLVKWLVSL